MNTPHLLDPWNPNTDARLAKEMLCCLLPFEILNSGSPRGLLSGPTRAGGQVWKGGMVELRLFPGAALKSGMMSVPGLGGAGCPQQEALGRNESQLVHTLPTPESPSWPPTVWRLQTFLPLCPGKVQGFWLSLVPPCPAPKVTTQRSLAFGALLELLQGHRQGRGGEPSGRGTGISGSPGVPSHAGDSQ